MMIPIKCYKRFLIIFSIFVFSSIIINCASAPELSYISFDNQQYQQIDWQKVNFYNSRLDIGRKYKEIGVLVIQGNHEDNFIRQQAAIRGANCIVKDGKNYILILTDDEKQQKGNQNETNI